jgi:thiamine pyrophosphokinase
LPALLLCNGEPPPRSLAVRLAARAGIIVAADGGANTARRYGIRPDAIVGDLDSVAPATLRLFSTSQIVRVDRQDNTDLEKSLDFLRSRGTREVDILGLTGRRVDFTLGNLSVLWNYTRAMRLCVHGDGWRGYLIESRFRMHARRGTTVSLIPFGTCRGITLQGLQYPLRNASMAIGRIGVSNVVRHSPFSVSLRSGRLLLVAFDAAVGHRP